MRTLFLVLQRTFLVASVWLVGSALLAAIKAWSGSGGMDMEAFRSSFTFFSTYFGIVAIAAAGIWMRSTILGGVSGGGFSDDDDETPGRVPELRLNPATGLIEAGPGYNIDSGGNVFGTSNDDSSDSAFDDNYRP